MTTDLATADPALRAIQIGLERAGWTIIAAEIDLGRETARVEIKRHDGRYITFDARDGRSTITREHMGRRNPVDHRGEQGSQIDMRFLGRSSHEGARSGLRALCSYLADNATSPLSAIDARRLFALAMDGSPHALTTGAP